MKKHEVGEMVTFEDTLSELRRKSLEFKSEITGCWLNRWKPATTSNLPVTVPTTSSTEQDKLPTSAIEIPVGEHARTVDLIEEIAGINVELASYVCIEEKAGLSVDYKKRVKELKDKKTDAEKKLKQKLIEQKAQQKVLKSQKSWPN